MALVARRRTELEELAEQLRAVGAEPLVVQCDVAERAQVFDSGGDRADRFGSVEILVNNAGYGHHRPFLEWDLDDMEHLMQVNFFGSLYWTKALLPRMVEQRRGWLVFIASVAGKIGVPDESAYAASKFAQVGLAEALSYEVRGCRRAGPHTVCPGTIRTPFFDAEALERMPPVAKRSMVEPEGLVDAIFKALGNGRVRAHLPASDRRRLCHQGARAGLHAPQRQAHDDRCRARPQTMIG